MKNNNIIISNNHIEKTANRLKEAGMEYFHQDFQTFANNFLQHSSEHPIILQGPAMSGKKTMVDQLSTVLNIKPKKYDFVNFTIDEETYHSHDAIINDLRKSYQRGETVVIENLDKMGTYDNILLSLLVEEFYHNPNPKFHMIILESKEGRTFRSLSDKTRKYSVTVNIGKDPVIEEKIQKKLEEEQKEQESAKQKTFKGVK